MLGQEDEEAFMEYFWLPCYDRVRFLYELNVMFPSVPLFGVDNGGITVQRTSKGG